MKWKNRLTNYNFWISIVSAVLLILQAFNFEFDIAYINEIATAVLGLLVVIGIISDPTKTYTPSENIKDTTETTEAETKEAPVSTEEIVETKQEQTVADNVKAENVDVYNQGSFQTIIDYISKELNKCLPKEEKKEETAEETKEEPVVYNIVNQ